LRIAQKDGFSDCFNSEVSSDLSAHYLAIFIHKMMQKEDPLSKSKNLVKEIRDVPVSLIIGIFRLLTSKDIFENFFTKYLGERLLHKKSASLDRELEFVGEIKNECGQQFFHRVEQMFKDMSLSEEIVREYKSVDPRKKKFRPQYETEFFILS
jgi:hypothetical protein